MGESKRPSRREVLAGAIGAAAALGGEAGASALRRLADHHQAGPPGVGAGAPADLPYLIGTAESDLPAGLVRADLRAFKKDTGSDYHQAFSDALSAADAVYVPPGVWTTGQPVEVSAGKVLWSDTGFDKEDIPVSGAIVRASTSMPAAVRLVEPAAMLLGVNVDGASVADAAIEFASDSVFLGQASAKRGKSYALKATGSFCTVWGGVYQQPSDQGIAMYVEGSDLVMWGTRIKKGAVPLWLNGSGGLLGILHVTGKNEPGHPSEAVVRVTGARNQLVNVFYDTSVGPSLLLEGGASFNRFVGMTIRNSGSDGTFPVIRCDATAGGNVRSNRFDAFATDAALGKGWTYLLEMLGPSPALSGNQLGSGFADGCQGLWNTRPATVGDIASDGKRTRNGGGADLPAGSSSLVIAHGLKGEPDVVGVTPSRGPSPTVSVDQDHITLAWAGSPGALHVWWTAEL